MEGEEEEEEKTDASLACFPLPRWIRSPILDLSGPLLPACIALRGQDLKLGGHFRKLKVAAPFFFLEEDALLRAKAHLFGRRKREKSSF